MPDPKRDALDMLQELGELTVLDEGDPQAFRVRAYESAYHAIDAFPGDPSKLTAAELQRIEGIGKSTASKLRELFETGKVEKLEELRAKHPRAVVELLQIPGLGPKAVSRLRAELGVGSVDDLRRAVAERRLRDLRGFGKKSEENLARVLDRLDRDGAGKRTPISVALPLAERIVAEVSEVPGVVEAAYCGSLRRFCETIGDLDIVVASADPAPALERIRSLPMIESVVGSGEAKTSLVTRKGMQIDVRVVAPHQIGAATLYFTGSKGHNIKLRQRALDRGTTLNEYALTEIDTGRVVASETEEAIYEALGLAWIHPVLREDAGEIELANRRALPRPIPPESVAGDFHVHTTLSGDGRSSLEEMVSAARARGYGVLAITEHAENLPVSGVARERLLEQRARVDAMQRELGDSLLLLHGIELNIGPDGELDYDPEFRAAFDWCLASVHDHFDLPADRQTRRIVAAMREPSVKMIGHLQARMIGARPPIDIDTAAVIAAAEETGTALEINGGLPRLDCTLDVLRAARDKNVTFVLTSDAHHTRELERMRYAGLHAMKAWVEPDKVMNTWGRARMVEWIRGS